MGRRFRLPGRRAQHWRSFAARSPRGFPYPGLSYHTSKAVQRLLILFLLPFLASAADWNRYVYGPFEVLSAAGERPGQEALNELEQIRFTLGLILGRPELEATWPFRLVLFNSERDAAKYHPGAWREGRDAWMLAAVKGQPLPHRQLVQILLDANTLRLPEGVEDALLQLFDPVKIDGNEVTIGIPPPPERRDVAWARMHLLVCTPEYSGRVRVMFSNLEQDADWNSTYKNAFSMTPEEVDAKVKSYLAAGQFTPREISAAPVSARRFSARDLPTARVETALADLLDGDAARAAYTAVLEHHSGYADALEGLGRYQEALQAGSQSARAYVASGRRQTLPVRARAAYERATELNPKWAEPWVLMAGIDTTLALKITDLRQASKLAPRDAAIWTQLAEAFTEAKDTTEAQRAWGGAMRAAATDEEREEYYQRRLALDNQSASTVTSKRLERAEERRIERGRQREQWMELLNRSKTKEEAAASGSEGDVVQWWDDPRPKMKVSGVLSKVDCISGLARLVIQQADDTVVQVLVRDPSKIVLLGGDEKTTLGCGVQQPPRPVDVEYFSEPDAKWNTAGEASVIQFQGK